MLATCYKPLEKTKGPNRSLKLNYLFLIEHKAIGAYERSKKAARTYKTVQNVQCTMLRRL